MRQLTCKSLSIVLINIFLLTFSVSAQDTTGTKNQTTKAGQPAKVATPAPSKPARTQSVTPAARVDNSLSGQYEALLKHSWMQQGYKVVNPARLTTLWKSVNDSLNSNKKQIAEARQRISELEKQIAASEDDPGKTAAPEKPSAPARHVEVLGMAVDMPTYNWVVWGTILLLALCLAGVLFSTTKNSFDSKQYKLQYEEVSAEYQNYKTKAKEKELKLARELQTERNTIEDLLAKKDEEASIKRGKK